MGSISAGITDVGDFQVRDTVDKRMTIDDRKEAQSCRHGHQETHRFHTNTTSDTCHTKCQITEDPEKGGGGSGCDGSGVRRQQVCSGCRKRM